MFVLAFSWLFCVCFCRSFLSLVFTGYVSSFSICFKAGLVVLNSLNFCLPVNLLISSSILNKIFVHYSKVGYRFFSFTTLNISFIPFWPAVSAEISAVNYMGFPLYVTCYFSLAAFNILSLCLSLLAWLMCVLICFTLGLSCKGLCASWTQLTISLSHVGEIFNHNFLKIFLSDFLFFFLLWDPYNSNVGAFNIVPKVSEAIFYSLHSILLFCSSAVISTILSSSSVMSDWTDPPAHLSIPLPQLFGY